MNKLSGFWSNGVRMCPTTRHLTISWLLANRTLYPQGRRMTTFGKNLTGLRTILTTRSLALDYCAPEKIMELVSKQLGSQG